MDRVGDDRNRSGRRRFRTGQRRERTARPRHVRPQGQEADGRDDRELATQRRARHMLAGSGARRKQRDELDRPRRLRRVVMGAITLVTALRLVGFDRRCSKAIYVYSFNKCAKSICRLRRRCEQENG